MLRRHLLMLRILTATIVPVLLFSDSLRGQDAPGEVESEMAGQEVETDLRQMQELPDANNPGSENKEDVPLSEVDETGKPLDNGTLPPADSGVTTVDLRDLEGTTNSDPNWNSTYTKPGVDVSGVIKVEEIIEPPSEYHYASFGSPNPFIPPTVTLLPQDQALNANQLEVNDLGEGRGAEIPIVNILQSYPLSDLMVKGIWELSSGEMRAIVMTPNKEGIIVKANDPISAGKVLEINESGVTVRQYKMRGDGVREYSDQIMHLGELKKQISGRIRLEPGKGPVFEVRQPASVLPPAATDVTPPPPALSMPPSGAATAPQAAGSPPGSVVPGPTPAATTPANNQPVGGQPPLAPNTTTLQPPNSSPPAVTGPMEGGAYVR